MDLNDPTVASAARNVPKIIHQTWKTNVLPDRWQPVRASCAALHPDWEYMLWTDASGRELIESHYAWFLDTFDGYRYPIQRADAVRYFVLHRCGSSLCLTMIHFQSLTDKANPLESIPVAKNYHRPPYT